MSTVDAHIGVAKTSARAAVTAPAWVWIGIVAGVVLMVWQYCRVQDSETPDWLDPNQPPISVPVDFSTTMVGNIDTAVGHDGAPHRKPKTYPWMSLMEHPCCWVGDC